MAVWDGPQLRMKKFSPWKPDNRLLDDLPGDVCDRLTQELRTMELPVGKVLYEAHAQQYNMYFPRGGIVSLLYDTAEGSSGAVALIGNEGMVGTALLVDSHSTPSRAVVLVAGEALVLSAEAVAREFSRGGAFQVTLLRYVQAQIAQMAQTAICNRHHSVEKQLCRWLLLCEDRIGTVELQMTQEMIAKLLGVRREGVTEAVGRLQEAGLIQYSRGRIRILDRAGLEARSCECYQVVNDEYARVLQRPLQG